MRIVDTIRNILQIMVEDENCSLQSYVYDNLYKQNVRIDRNNPLPTALFLQVTDFSLPYNQLNVREKCSVIISFLTKDDVDNTGENRDDKIDQMKDLAVEFVQRLSSVKSLAINNKEILCKTVIARYDVILTGVTIELNLEEKQGECVGGSISNIKHISTNGTYSMRGIDEVIVNV